MPRLKLIATAFALATLTAPAARAAEPIAALEAEVARLSVPAKGVVGVAARRLDSEGPRLSVNGGQSFPMASTFKVAVAGAILTKVDRGEISLDRMVIVDPNLHVASEIIAERFIHPGVSLSVYNLIELMLTQSDNTATDVLTTLVGGPETVTAWVRGQGIEGLRVDRDTAGLLRDFFSLPPGPFPTAFKAGLKADPELEAKSLLPNAAFDDDPRDTSTPNAMVELLDRIFSGKALKPTSTKLLIAAMERNRTGNARIKARLPKGTLVAEKTGTIGGAVNDVGVITLPGNAGKIVLAVFVKKSAVSTDVRAEVIADIARSVYDFYLFQSRR